MNPIGTVGSSWHRTAEFYKGGQSKMSLLTLSMKELDIFKGLPFLCILFAVLSVKNVT